MKHIYFFSGPCGCGKSTLADAWAKHLVNNAGRRQVYVIHGDDFHAGFVEPDAKGDFFVDGLPGDSLAWEQILEFNWACIIDVADKALARGLDVVIDYVIEEELPLVKALAKKHGAQLHYAVVTADEGAIRRRITQRGDVDMIDRAIFLKHKLENMPENQGHLLDNTALAVAEEIALAGDERFIVNNL